MYKASYVFLTLFNFTSDFLIDVHESDAYLLSAATITLHQCYLSLLSKSPYYFQLFVVPLPSLHSYPSCKNIINTAPYTAVAANTSKGLATVSMLSDMVNRTRNPVMTPRPAFDLG